MKILPVVAEFFHADGRTGRQTDRHKEANSLFRNLPTRLKTSYILAVMVCYAAQIGSYLPTFRDDLPVPYSRGDSQKRLPVP